MKNLAKRAPFSVDNFTDICTKNRMKALLENRWLPRDYEMVAEFISLQMETGKVYVFFGVGTHTMEIVKRLVKEKVNLIKTIFDSRSESGQLGEYKIPIKHISKIKNFRFDKVILSHNNFELTMADDLKGLEVDESKIISIYSNPAYSKLLHETDYQCKYFSTPVNIPQNKKVIAFVSTAPMRIVNPYALRLLKEKDDFHFINLNMERDVERRDDNNSAYDFVIDCKESFLLLTEWIKRINPELVYIHDQFAHSSFCYGVLRDFFPKLKIITELYDILELLL